MQPKEEWWDFFKEEDSLNNQIDPSEKIYYGSTADEPSSEYSSQFENDQNNAEQEKFYSKEKESLDNTHSEEETEEKGDKQSYTLAVNFGDVLKKRNYEDRISELEAKLEESLERQQELEQQLEERNQIIADLMSEKENSQSQNHSHKGVSEQQDQFGHSEQSNVNNSPTSTVTSNRVFKVNDGGESESQLNQYSRESENVNSPEYNETGEMKEHLTPSTEEYKQEGNLNSKEIYDKSRLPDFIDTNVPNQRDEREKWLRQQMTHLKNLESWVVQSNESFDAESIAQMLIEEARTNPDLESEMNNIDLERLPQVFGMEPSSEGNNVNSNAEPPSSPASVPSGGLEYYRISSPRRARSQQSSPKSGSKTPPRSQTFDHDPQYAVTSPHRSQKPQSKRPSTPNQGKNKRRPYDPKGNTKRPRSREQPLTPSSPRAPRKKGHLKQSSTSDINFQKMKHSDHHSATDIDSVEDQSKNISNNPRIKRDKNNRPILPRKERRRLRYEDVIRAMQKKKKKNQNKGL
eukprot:gb/GECH01013401.1/.p1 GENE.gb/GECH01013401.1/~~gb/GECH01013401.1/.p1  ORF type:complete len:519 (+),score=166.80 gb/GECH01013401.1/:1-1557(+)